MTDLPENTRQAGHDIHPMFLRRWSPRAFTGEEMPAADLLRMFEAANWAPSAFNYQPWNFVYAMRETENWGTFLNLLVPGNQMWAHAASALVFIVSDRFMRIGDAAPRASHSHSFDSGAAWGYLALQCERMGYAAHGMTGFDQPRAYETLNVPEDGYRIEAVIAIGKQAPASVLPEKLAARESPNARKPVEQSVFEGAFKAPAAG